MRYTPHQGRKGLRSEPAKGGYVVETMMVLLQPVSYLKTDSQKTLLQAIKFSSQLSYMSEVYGFKEAT